MQRFAQRQLEDVASRGRRQALDNRQPFLQVVHGLLERHPRQRQFAGEAPQRHRRQELPRLGTVMGDELGGVLDRPRVQPLERVRNVRVHLFALAVEQ